MKFHGIKPEKAKALIEKMQKLGILESDLDEKFIRASGKGGQKVNKTSSCVSLKHKPTGLLVKVDVERSRSTNRFFARRLLLEKYEQQILGVKTKKNIEEAKKAKQKKRRLRKTKKKEQSEIEVKNASKS